MAFNVSYRTLNDQNIRHIYSDQKHRYVFRKSYAFRPLKEELPIPPLRLYPKRFFDYYPSYQIGIPRAPAFRGTNQEHVERIVKRICKPIQCQKARRKDNNNKEEEGRGGGEGEESENEKREEGEKDGGRKKGDDYEDDFEEDDDDGDNDDLWSPRSSKMGAKDMKDLITRLQKPTQSWEKKKYNPEDRKIKERESEIPKLPPIPARC